MAVTSDKPVIAATRRRGPAPRLVAPRAARGRTRRADRGTDGHGAERSPDTEAVAEPSARPRFDDGKGESLGKYFQEMSQLDVLKPEEEFAHARRIEALEVALWAEVLGHGPAIEFVAARIEASLDNSLPELRTLRRLALARRGRELEPQQRKVAARAAGKLRALDTDRIHLEGLLVELYRIREGRSGRPGREPPTPRDAR